MTEKKKRGAPRRLTDKEKDAIFQCWTQGLTPKEAAEKVGTTDVTTRSYYAKFSGTVPVEYRIQPMEIKQKGDVIEGIYDSLQKAEEELGSSHDLFMEAVGRKEKGDKKLNKLIQIIFSSGEIDPEQANGLVDLLIKVKSANNDAALYGRLADRFLNTRARLYDQWVNVQMQIFNITNIQRFEELVAQKLHEISPEQAAEIREWMEHQFSIWASNS